VDYTNTDKAPVKLSLANTLRSGLLQFDCKADAAGAPKVKFTKTGNSAGAF
jgi:hypothetical protein